MPSMQQFIDRVGLEIDILPAHYNPSMPNTQEMNHWSCKISKDQRAIVLSFSRGALLRLWKMPQNPDLWPLISGQKIGTVYTGPVPFFNSYEDQEIFEKCSEPEPPNLLEILECLAKDISTIELSDGDFLKWAASYKFDPKKPSTRTAYEGVILECAKIKALLTDEEYQLFIQTSLEADNLTPALS